MTFTQRLLWLALLLTLMLMPGRALAYQHPAHDELPDLDKRLDRLPKVKAPTPAHMAEVQKLQAQVPGLRVEQDEVRGSPKHIASTRGFLTGPRGEGKSVSSARMQKLPASDPHRSIKAFVDEHAALFGHDASALKAARVRKDFTSRRNGVRSILWEQQVDDIPVFEGVLLGHLTAQGELVSLSSQFIADPVRAADLGTPNRAALRLQPAIAAVQAVILAADNLGEALLPVEVRSLDALPQGAELRQRFPNFLFSESLNRANAIPIEEFVNIIRAPSASSQSWFETAMGKNNLLIGQSGIAKPSKVGRAMETVVPSIEAHRIYAATGKQATRTIGMVSREEAKKAVLESRLVSAEYRAA